jgi:uncharacterized phiE125 gp8 family phage protein
MFYGHHENGDGGRAVLIDPPTDPAVTLADAKKALGISDSGQDLIIGAAIAAASDALDPAFGGWLGRALRTQTWELQLRGFSRRHHSFCFLNPRQAQEAHYIVLPYPPLQSIESVKYLDVNGVSQTLVKDTDFRVIGQGQPYGKAAIAPLYAQTWPVPRFDDASVRIQFTCGYDENDFIMPKALKAAIVLGARALMSVSARDMLLFEDRVEGLGSKRYQNNPAAADIVNKAVSSLLFNLAIS